MQRVHLLWVVIRRSGASKALAIFLATYLLCGLIVLLFEPNISSYGDALWFLWAVSTTVGLGDLTAITHVGRFATVVCSLCAITSTAIVTGVIVDYFCEARQHQLGESISEFLDKLERLPELDKSELQDISQRVRRFRK